MKKSIFILSLLLIVALAGCIILVREYNAEKKERLTLQEQYDLAIKENGAIPLEPKDTIFIDSSKVTYIYNPIRTTGPIDGYVSKGLADTLATSLKVAVKEIDRLQSMLITADAKGKGERTKDTVTKTEWLVMKPDPVFDVKVNLTNDSIFPSANIRLSQAYAPYRKNIFSRYQYRSAIMASDPRIRISEVYDVNRVPKSPRWGIGLTVGPVVSPKGLTWGASLGLSYDVIQF
ncbi:hypothetical protein [Sphingobacterium mizutaii]|uniref:hypothetical protein n=1 Tax=Sphingobacterium mizutaii TaxID=1010 RepID=UPI00162814F5|nr:hypothetical protein [Sphingobacterium mizutaii]